MNKKNYLLVKTSIDENFFDKKNKLYLGYFCISKNSKLNKFNSKNVVDNHWKLNHKNLFEKNKYFKKLQEDMLFFLTKKLNKIHNMHKSKEYWRLIISPWIISYLTVIYDRWFTISEFKKKYKKYNFFTYEYNNEQNFSKNLDYWNWYKSANSDLYNNYLFNRIIKFRNISNIKIIKKYNYKYKYFNIKESKTKFSLYYFIDFLLSKLAIFFNTIYFDKIYMGFYSFLKFCFKLKQIPGKNLIFFKKLSLNQSYDIGLRNSLFLEKKKNSKFENFLYSEIKYSFPLSYLENYKNYLNSFKKFLKKKRIFLGSSSIEYDDEFKIFLSESKLNGSKFFYYEHGAGFQNNYRLLFKYFLKTCDKYILLQKQKKFSHFTKKINLHLPIFYNFKKYILTKEKKKILIIYHEHDKYLFKFPCDTPPFCFVVENFKNFLNSFKSLNKELKNHIKFRLKTPASLNSDIRFAKIFGIKTLEDINSKKLNRSIEESKLVICVHPQTSYVESIYRNVPTILLGNKFGIFRNPDNLGILKKLKLVNMYFDDYDLAVKFINSNSKKIFEWWNNYKTQEMRKFFLSKYYYAPDTNFEKFKNFCKKEIEHLN